MAPIPHTSDDSENKASAKLNSLVDRIQKISAHSKALRQNLYDSQIPMAATLKELTERIQHAGAVVFEGSEHQLQEVTGGRLAYRPEGAVEELPATMKASDGSTTGEGKVNIDAFAHHVEILRERNREMLARMEEVSSMIEQIHTAQLLFVDGVNDLANVGILETGFVAGTLAVLFIIAVMLCSAFNLLSERQARVFGLGVIAVCFVIRFGGI